MRNYTVHLIIFLCQNLFLLKIIMQKLHSFYPRSSQTILVMHEKYFRFLCWMKLVKVKVKSLSRARLFTTPWIVTCTKLLRPWDFQSKSTGVGCHFLLQGIFPTQGSNPGPSHCRQMLYGLCHQGSPQKLLRYNLNKMQDFFNVFW